MKRIKKLKKIIVTGCVCLLMIISLTMGCGSKENKGIEVKKGQITNENQATEEVGRLDLSKVQNADAKQATPGSVNTDKTDSMQTTADSAQNAADASVQVQSEIVVYVCGAVNNPGVYTLSGTPRMTDAVEAAGGMNEQADKNVLNLAQYISDGQMIRIPAIGEVTDTEDWVVQQSSDGDENKADNSDAGQTSGKIDLNSADVTQLMTIPGIGQTKAEAIIRYREENGRFEKVEDIMQISGIKEGSFAKMEPYICVN